MSTIKFYYKYSYASTSWEFLKTQEMIRLRQKVEKHSQMLANSPAEVSVALPAER